MERVGGPTHKGGHRSEGDRPYAIVGPLCPRTYKTNREKQALYAKINEYLAANSEQLNAFALRLGEMAGQLLSSGIEWFSTTALPLSDFKTLTRLTYLRG